jgi:hypothetical protein
MVLNAKNCHVGGRRIIAMGRVTCITVSFVDMHYLLGPRTDEIA